MEKARQYGYVYQTVSTESFTNIEGDSVPSLLRDWRDVHLGVADSEDAYNQICGTITDDQKAEWLEVEADAQARRWEDKTAMDVYDVKEDTGSNISMPIPFHFIEILF